MDRRRKAVTVGLQYVWHLKHFRQIKDLRLKHTTSDHSVLIEKKNIAFLDEEYENMSFTTDEELSGYYELVLEFTDPILNRGIWQIITLEHKLWRRQTKKYRLKSYGTIAFVRTTDKSNNTNYDFSLLQMRVNI